jgi:hypothetical protein
MKRILFFGAVWCAIVFAQNAGSNAKSSMYNMVDIKFVVAASCGETLHIFIGQRDSALLYADPVHPEFEGSIWNAETTSSYICKIWAKDSDSGFSAGGCSPIYTTIDPGFDAFYSVWDGFGSWYIPFENLKYISGSSFNFGNNDSLCYSLEIACNDPLVYTYYGHCMLEAIKAETCFAWTSDPGSNIEIFNVIPLIPGHFVDYSKTLIQLPTLGQNNPNPFNAVTDINFNLPANSHVKLEVTDVLGKHVATLIDGTKATGSHVARWEGKTDNGGDCTSGVYFYKLSVGDNFVDKKKMTLVK